MKGMRGVTLIELLISLTLSSLLITLVVQQYLNVKKHYLSLEKLIDKEQDFQWIANLLRDTIRRAGFTPCGNIQHLISFDHLTYQSIDTAIQWNKNKSELKIERMSENFFPIIIKNLHQISLKKQGDFLIGRRVIIADCYHAEIHKIKNIVTVSNIYLIETENSLKFTFQNPVYIGNWLEEKYLIKKNYRAKEALFYHLNHSEELSEAVSSFSVENFDNIWRIFLKSPNHKKIEILARVRSL